MKKLKKKKKKAIPGPTVFPAAVPCPQPNLSKNQTCPSSCVLGMAQLRPGWLQAPRSPSSAHLELFKLEKRRLRRNLSTAFQYIEGAYKEEGERVFTRACSNRGNGFKLEEGGFRIDTRMTFFTISMVTHI